MHTEGRRVLVELDEEATIALVSCLERFQTSDDTARLLLNGLSGVDWGIPDRDGAGVASGR